MHAVRLLLWALVTCVHGCGMAFLMTAWLVTPWATPLPMLVLCYWKYTSNVCHFSTLEAALHPRGFALFRPVPKWSARAVACVQVAALLTRARIWA
jgi:hypothetical protein